MASSRPIFLHQAQEMDLLNISNVMTQNSLITANLSDLPKAEKILKKYKIEKLPIIDENNKLVGLITFKDIIHFVGIGGIGMSALAKFFLFRNIEVSGYDKVCSSITKSLSKDGGNLTRRSRAACQPSCMLEA